MKIKITLFAAMLFASISYANNTSNQDIKVKEAKYTTAKNVKGYLALTSIASTALGHLVAKLLISETLEKFFKDDLIAKLFNKFDPADYIEVTRFLCSSPAFFHDVMAVALEDDSSVIIRLDKFAKAIVEGLENSAINGNSDDWKSSKTNQIILSIALYAAIETLDTIASKKIKTLPIKCRYRKNAIRALFKAVLNILSEGFIKPALQDGNPIVLATEADLEKVVLTSLAREAAVVILGECVRHDFKLEGDDTKLLEEAVLEAEKNEFVIEENIEEKKSSEEEVILPTSETTTTNAIELPTESLIAAN